jgi:hypothetical protein
MCGGKITEIIIFPNFAKYEDAKMKKYKWRRRM